MKYLKDILDGILSEYEIEEGDTIKIKASKADMPVLIGKKGYTLNAIQRLMRINDVKEGRPITQLEIIEPDESK